MERKIYILSARGIGSDCASAIQAMLHAGRRASEIIKASQIVHSVRRGVDVFVVPGGMDYDGTMHVLRRNQADAFIEAHVNEGGIYMGHCLGADIAPLLNIFSGTVVDPVSDKKPLAVSTLWDQGRSRRVMYFQDGPRFFPKMKHTVLATFAQDLAGDPAGIFSGDAAALMYDWGKGKVGLISPHPEANAIWMAQLGGAAPRELTYDLGHHFYDQVLGPLTP